MTQYTRNPEGDADRYMRETEELGRKVGDLADELYAKDIADPETVCIETAEMLCSIGSIRETLKAQLMKEIANGTDLGKILTDHLREQSLKIASQILGVA